MWLVSGNLPTETTLRSVVLGPVYTKRHQCQLRVNAEMMSAIQFFLENNSHSSVGCNSVSIVFNCNVDYVLKPRLDVNGTLRAHSHGVSFLIATTQQIIQCERALRSIHSVQFAFCYQLTA